MDSSGTKVPLVSGDGRQVPEELKPLHDYYEKWNNEMVGTWSNVVSEKVRDIWELNPNLKISQCIVIGLGSLDIASQMQHIDPLIAGLDHYPTKVKQFIVVRMTMDYIKEAAHPIKTYFQDPLFTELDKTYLGYHGYKVLEVNSGLDMLDSTTLLFNMRCSIGDEEWLAILKAPYPVYAGLSFEHIIEGLMLRKQQAKQYLAKDMSFDIKDIEDYMNITNAYSFPSLEDHWAFGDFAIRVVKTVHKDHQQS